MKSRLTFSTLEIRTTELEKSEFPDLFGHNMLQNDIDFQVGEDEHLFEAYGTRKNAYPYRQQNIYTRELAPKSFKTAILENDYIKATFLPELGGRLWSLIDKTTGRNLLYTNTSIRYSNLAILNAWFSGGVEWNIGMIGHTPFTNEPLYVAKLETDDGTPVLRMYETERVRSVTYQMDFYLPKDSKSLLCRMRVTNEEKEVVPMYWWSNIAVPEYPEGRIVMPASSAYSFLFDEHNRGSVQKVEIPVVNGTDVTKYCNIYKQVDYFFDLDNSPVKYLAQTDRTGYGLMHISTSRLRSRKIFSWGSNTGSDNWQNFLTDKAGRYIELQAGLGKTQYGCIPMPPMSSWEWMESYGPVTLDNSLEWEDFKDEATAKARKAIENLDFEQLLKSTRKTIAKQKGDLVQTGSPASAMLRHMRPTGGRRTLTEQLEFPLDHQLYDKWIQLIENGKLFEKDAESAPDAFFNEPEVLNALQSIPRRSWYTDYHLSLLYYSKEDYRNAYKAAVSSIEKKETCWAYHALAAIQLQRGDTEGCAAAIASAVNLRPSSLSLMKDAFKVLLQTGHYQDILDIYENRMDKELQKNTRLRYSCMIALYHTGRYREALSIISENGGLVPDDIREGDDELERVYLNLLQKLELPQSVPSRVKFRSL